MQNNEERELVELIWTYYPKSSMMRALQNESVPSIQVRLLFFGCLALVGFATSYWPAHTFLVINTYDWIVLVLFIAIMWAVSLIALTLIFEWLFGDLFLQKLEARRKFRKMLKEGLYSSELILGTVEALEAELSKKQSLAVQAISRYEEKLRRHRGALEGVKEKISERINAPSTDESKQLTDRFRLKEAEGALDHIASELAELEEQRRKVAVSTEPANKLIEYLRYLYADAQEVEVIARAKAIVLLDQKELVSETVRQLQGAAVRACENLEVIANLAQAKLDAEREIEQVLGILPLEEKLKA